MKKYDYDLIVIGGGAAGFVSSKFARGIGKKVAMIEKGRLGGECTNFGCIPSKALIRTANVAHQIARMREFGLESGTPVDLKTDNVMARVRSAVNTVYNGHPAEKFEAQGIAVLFGSPQFTDNHTITLEGRTLTAEKFIIATGSSAFVPPIEGISDVPYLTNENVFEMDSLPRSLIALGGGPIGMELAAAFNRLGVEVTVVEMLDRVLFREDRELAEMLVRRLEAEGLKFVTSAQAVKISQSDGNIVMTVRRGEQTRDIRAEKVLVAVGRKANVEGLGLERARIKYSNKGIVTDRTLRTTAENIFACGDVAGPYQFSHMAEYQAVLACTNAFLPVKRKADYTHVVWTTFTDPELAHAGLTEDEARERHGDGISVYRYNYRSMDRAVTDAEEYGMSKYVCARSGRLVGIHILGSHATEVMHEAQLAKTLGIPFAKIRSVIHSYPSYSDAVYQPSKVHAVEKLQNNFFVKVAKKLLSK